MSTKKFYALDMMSVRSESNLRGYENTPIQSRSIELTLERLSELVRKNAPKGWPDGYADEYALYMWNNELLGRWFEINHKIDAQTGVSTWTDICLAE